MKYTVITGASSGIGYETARLFAQQGFNLILVARRLDRLEDLKNKLLQDNPSIDVILKQVDLSEVEAIMHLYQSLSTYDIETWINNAGVGDSGPLVDESIEKIEQQLNINVRAVTLLSHLYAKDYAMCENAQLINVSSALGYAIAPNNLVYSATKFYVSAFSEGLATELKLQGALLKVKVLAPAITETEFAKISSNDQNFDYKTQMKQYHTAEEMAQFMLQLYQSNQTVGIVDGSYQFSLRDHIFLIISS